MARIDFIPQEGDRVYIIGLRVGWSSHIEVQSFKWNWSGWNGYDPVYLRHLLILGNVFKTESEAHAFLADRLATLVA